MVQVLLERRFIRYLERILQVKGKLKLTGEIILFFIILFAFISSDALAFSSQKKSSPSMSLDPYLFTVETHNIKIDIIQIDEIKVAERFTVRNTQNSTLDSIEVWINQTLSDLFVTDYNGSLSFDDTEISDSSHLIDVSFRTELFANSTTSFDIWYNLERYPIAENGHSYYYFEFSSSVTYFTEEQLIEVKIPERSFIHEEYGLTSYFPSDGFALAGQRVYLSWTFENLDALEDSFIFVRFDKPLQDTPVTAIVLGVLGGIILGAGLTILFMRKREKKVVRQISTIYLSDTQKTLLRLISENNGKILQKELCSETGFTKSRISRNITPLVEQGLVKRERWGRNFVIRLTESGMKVIE